MPSTDSKHYTVREGLQNKNPANYPLLEQQRAGDTGKYRTRTRQPSEVGEKYKIVWTKSKLHQGRILCITLRQPARREDGSRQFDLFTLFFIVA